METPEAPQGKMVGLKQTRKALLGGQAEKVYVARDAEARVYAPIVALCEETRVPVVWVDTMAALGAFCGIEVGAAVAAELRQTAEAPRT